MPTILILNGSIQGKQGNTQKLIMQLSKDLLERSPQAVIEVVELSEVGDLTPIWIQQQFSRHDAFVFCTGTYWDSWGHPLQKLLEEMTFLEGKKEILGKPASVLVTMHSVGGKEVCSRLQGVLATMGFLIPPMSHLVYSLSNHLAQKSESEFALDFWSFEDLQVISHNLLSATKSRNDFLSWAVDEKDPRRNWI